MDVPAAAQHVRRAPRVVDTVRRLLLRVGLLLLALPLGAMAVWALAEPSLFAEEYGYGIGEPVLVRLCFGAVAALALLLLLAAVYPERHVVRPVMLVWLVFALTALAVHLEELPFSSVDEDLVRGILIAMPCAAPLLFLLARD